MYVLVPGSAQDMLYHHFFESDFTEGNRSFARMRVPVEWINISYLFISCWM